MKAKKQLRKPENWQDFESLCKKLWGEIWKCPEIKKHGRQGQAQYGVDIFGVPFGENDYYGIQCKGKDDYTNAQLTESEIDSEINKALGFNPPLKKLYFATTANKNSTIEAYVRKKNIENKIKGLFEVHLFSWEDIVDLIDENKQTYDYYVKSLNYKANHDINFTFQNDQQEITITVPFLKKTTHYKQKVAPAADTVLGRYGDLLTLIEKVKTPDSLWVNSFNHSYCRFYFRLHNTGTEPLKEFKIFLDFDGEFESIDTCTKGHRLVINPNIKYDTYIWNESKKGKITPLKNILVQDDVMAFDTICLKPNKNESKVIIKWKLVSLNYKTDGELLLNIIPEFKEIEETVFTEDPPTIPTEETIEDYITNGNEQEE